MKLVFQVILIHFFLVPQAMATAPIDHLEKKPSVTEKLEASVEGPTQKKQASTEVAALVGFQAWKQQQVFKAKAALETFKTPKAGEMSAEGALKEESIESSEEKAEIEQIQKSQAERLRQLEFNQEIALGLTIHDYFALYLKSKSKEDLAKVIPKLSPSELSELLTAYRRVLDGIPVVEKGNQKAIVPN